ncbi:hypothetical protein BP6252_08068 [Coleophoma cylindrospora]|uniref:RRM domain-containing protein n=1 Tax=Coleophoma cylindrospora TaxID=1849047 RepID=A0A3D8RBW1_9HELO|nr:hypothetical protein BP6252_08068 [Coleophoma cylindrospora]
MESPAFRALAARTVHIKMFPTARTFAERREVLRVIEKFGPVEMFQSLQYDDANKLPNAFITIFQTEGAARSLRESSPIRYRLVVGSPDAAADAAAAIEKASISPEASDEGSEDPSELEHVFQLDCSSSRYPHAEKLASPVTNRLGGPWKPVSPKQNAFAAALKQQMPKRLQNAGLQDWDSDRQRMDDLVNEDGVTHKPWRIVKGEMAAKAELGKISLKELWEQGQRKRGVSAQEEAKP